MLPLCNGYRIEMRGKAAKILEGFSGPSTLTRLKGFEPLQGSHPAYYPR